MSNFRDPIHGFVGLNEKECRIIDTFEYQRLRRVRQLGLSHLVYHGAEHSRFGHSIGTTELATRAFGSIVKNRKDLFSNQKEIDKLRQLLRLAALFHDFGHPPFSHVAESEIMPYKDEGENKRFTHEEWAAHLLESTEIGKMIDDLFEEHEITHVDVANLIQGKTISKEAKAFEFLLPQILSSQLDVDRMDYLLRDSHYCGVPYGIFDSERLIQRLTVDDSNGVRLAVDRGGLHSLEGLIIARYHMFIQVYFHDVRRSYDIILNRLIKQIFPDGLSADTGEFFYYDDNSVEDMIKHLYRNDDNLAKRLLERRHYKILHQSSVFCSSHESKWINSLKEGLKQEFPEYSEGFFKDKATNVFSKFLPLSVAQEGEGSELMVVDEHGNLNPVQEQSEIIKNMAVSKINIERLYCDDEIYEKAKEYVDQKERRSHE